MEGAAQEVTNLQGPRERPSAAAVGLDRVGDSTVPPSRTPQAGRRMEVNSGAERRQKAPEMFSGASDRQLEETELHHPVTQREMGQTVEPAQETPTDQTPRTL